MRLILLIPIFVFMLACSKDQPGKDHGTQDHQKENTEKPGRGSNHDLMLTDSQIKLANITTQKVTSQPIGQTLVVNGRLGVNQELTRIVSSRAAGRIEKMYVKETGRTIQKGEPLYELYSESLMTLQQEFLLAKEQYETLGTTRYKSFLDATERKLVLYGLTEGQIKKLSENKKVENTVTLLSPASGLVTDLTATEGQYVSEGTSLMKIEGIQKLWIEAELYPSESSMARIGDKITIKIAGYENENRQATIEFLGPEFRANTQIVSLRASISNADMKFKPGMQAQVFFSHSTKNALTIPADAVIRDEKGTHVYVQKGSNTFQHRVVTTGIEDFEKVEITGGLDAGDTVAVTGAYLLHSEFILKKGADAMAVHHH